MNQKKLLTRVILCLLREEVVFAWILFLYLLRAVVLPDNKVYWRLGPVVACALFLGASTLGNSLRKRIGSDTIVWRTAADYLAYKLCWYIEIIVLTALICGK